LAEKLTRIDATNIADHSKLTADDEVYFWREYTSGRDYSFGPGNDLVSNLKKKPSRANPREMAHKQRVIRECSAFFLTAINPDWLTHALFVPVPGSKAVGHPDYDERMVQIFSGIRQSPPINVRQLIRQIESTDAAHEAGPGHRPSVADLVANYAFDEAAMPAVPPRWIGIVDDVLTAGVHYRAVHNLLRQRFPQARIVGFFVARRVFPSDQNE
jgi:hypothetical protein